MTVGRTNPTFRDVLSARRQQWGDFRRALRRRDTHHFDRILEHAETHADAAGYQDGMDPDIAILLSIVLEQERRRATLEDRIDRLETRLSGESEAVESGVDSNEPTESDGAIEPGVGETTENSSKPTESGDARKPDVVGTPGDSSGPTESGGPSEPTTVGDGAATPEPNESPHETGTQ